MKTYFLMAVALAPILLTACEPRTPAQKVEDKIEDAGHETGQALERAGENVKDATK